MQRVDMAFRVVIDDAIGDDDRAAFVSGTDPVKGETTGQTSNCAEQAFECLSQMMRDVILEDC